MSVQTVASLRPLFQPAPDLAQVLQQGRVLDAEVLQTFTGGTVVLGVGGHRVSAESQVELRAGDELRVLVQGEGESLVLRVLEKTGGPEPELLRLLRAVVGEDRPIGERLLELAGALRAAGGGDALAARLEGALGEHVLRPDASGEELRALLARSGLGQEARLGELAELARGALAPEDARTPSLRALAQLALRELVDPAALGPEADELLARSEPALERALAEALVAGRREGGLQGFLRALGELLARAARLAPGELVARALAARADALDAARFATTRTGALVAHLLGLEPGPAPAELARAMLEAGLAEVGRDLKSRLLGALGRLEEGPAREAVARALAGLEAEQLIELARRSAQDWRGWSFPVPDADGSWRSARLFHRHGRRAAAGEEGEESSHHLVLGLELSRLGPLRADLWLGAGSLALRLRVHRPDAAERLRGEVPALRAALAGLREEVHVAVLAASPEEVSIDELALDVRYLVENPLLDLAG